MPENYKIPAHYHPVAEAVTVISGEVFVDMGDKLDMQKGIALHPGGFAYAPAGMRHYGWTTGGTVVQIDGNGLLESFTSTRRMTRAKVRLSKRLVEGRTPSAESTQKWPLPRFPGRRLEEVAGKRMAIQRAS